MLPFFIEDYRTNAAGRYGQDSLEASNKRQWLYLNVCLVLSGPDNDKIPLDWVYGPRFVHVTDDGTTKVMIDDFFRCRAPDRSSIISACPSGIQTASTCDQNDYRGGNETSRGRSPPISSVHAASKRRRQQRPRWAADPEL